jgi:hypothetical protein
VVEWDRSFDYAAATALRRRGGLLRRHLLSTVLLNAGLLHGLWLRVEYESIILKWHEAFVVWSSELKTSQSYDYSLSTD